MRVSGETRQFNEDNHITLWWHFGVQCVSQQGCGSWPLSSLQGCGVQYVSQHVGLWYSWPLSLQQGCGVQCVSLQDYGDWPLLMCRGSSSLSTCSSSPPSLFVYSLPPSLPPSLPCILDPPSLLIYLSPLSPSQLPSQYLSLLSHIILSFLSFSTLCPNTVVICYKTNWASSPLVSVQQLLVR